MEEMREWGEERGKRTSERGKAAVGEGGGRGGSGRRKRRRRRREGGREEGGRERIREGTSVKEQKVHWTYWNLRKSLK